MNSQRGKPTGGTERDRRRNERRRMRRAALQIMQLLLGSGVVRGLTRPSQIRVAASDEGYVSGN